jgi:hypothetical protein
MSEGRDLGGPCLFGSSAAETKLLIELGELLQPSTRQVLLNAGITEGMEVLDVGCGPGSVSLLAAELVGPAGWVSGSIATRRCWPLPANAPAPEGCAT